MISSPFTVRMLAFCGVLCVTSAGAVLAQSGTPAKSATPAKSNATAKPRISEDSARTVALREVPTGKVTKTELETENGKLIYSFDISVPAKSGIEEIHIDALTGKLLAREHEAAVPTNAPPKADASKKPAKP